ncbi:conserved Plasmodium protein, unknown function, partial [Plasmodium sp. gorilla clade G3]
IYEKIHINNNAHYYHNNLSTNKDLLVFKREYQSKHHTDILNNNHKKEKGNDLYKKLNVNENIKNITYEDNYNETIKRKRNLYPPFYKTLTDRERNKCTININNKCSSIKRSKSTICSNDNLVNLLKHTNENNITSKDKNYNIHIYNTIDKDTKYKDTKKDIIHNTIINNDKHMEKYNTNKKYYNNYITNKTYNNINNNNNNNNNYNTYQKYNLYDYTYYDQLTLKRRKTYANDNKQM